LQLVRLSWEELLLLSPTCFHKEAENGKYF
jgi:hypothetical protein